MKPSTRLTGRVPFTRWQRVLLTLISWATTIAVRLIGPTMKFAVSCEENSPHSLEQRPFVYSFWHQCTFAATYSVAGSRHPCDEQHQLRRGIHRSHDPPLRLSFRCGDRAVGAQCAGCWACARKSRRDTRWPSPLTAPAVHVSSQSPARYCWHARRACKWRYSTSPSIGHGL